VATVVLQYREAADDYSRAAAVVAPYDAHLAWVANFRKAQALEKQGEELGDDPALDESADAYRAVIATAQTPLDKAKGQNNLGNTLSSIASHERGTKHYEEALDNYRAALKQSPRDQDRVLWAERANNVATTLYELGRRKNDLSLMAKAIDDFRDTQTAYAGKDNADDRAMAQYNIAAALAAFGERDGDLNKFESAIKDAREAEAGGYARGIDPQDWAMVHTTLAIALDDLGRTKKDQVLVAQAVDTFKQALDVRRHERAPLDWAETQTNFGRALRDLADLTNREQLLVDAIKAERDALSEYRPDRAPPLWAAAEGQLCGSLSDLSRRRHDAEMLGEAAKVCRDAAEEFTAEQDRFDLAQVGVDLGLVQAALGEMSKKPLAKSSLPR
jgi:tetratricopeptide (TPR) repeat protein